MWCISSVYVCLCVFPVRPIGKWRCNSTCRGLAAISFFDSFRYFYSTFYCLSRCFFFFCFSSFWNIYFYSYFIYYFFYLLRLKEKRKLSLADAAAFLARLAAFDIQPCYSFRLINTWAISWRDSAHLYSLFSTFPAFRIFFGWFLYPFPPDPNR